jgi:hypothetical protein
LFSFVSFLLVLADVHVTNVKEDLGYKQIHGDDHKKNTTFSLWILQFISGQCLEAFARIFVIKVAK